MKIIKAYRTLATQKSPSFTVVSTVVMLESLVNKRDLHSLYLSGTYHHKKGIRPPSCVAPRQPTLYIYIDGSRAVGRVSQFGLGAGSGKVLIQ